MKTIGYVRVSTSKQEQFGGSIEAQKDMISRYCAMYGLELVDFLEDASSAKAIKSRPAMVALIDMCRNGEVEAFVTCKIDRMFRNTIEGLQTADEFEKLGVSMFFIEMGGTNADVSTARGRRIFAYDLIDAECERMRTGERTKTVLAHKKENGQQHSFYAPYGWKYVNKQCLPHAIEQKGLRLIWGCKQDGLGPTAIANKMSDSPFKTRNGRKIWATSTITSILSNSINDDLFAQWLEEENQKQHAANANENGLPTTMGNKEVISHV